MNECSARKRKKIKPDRDHSRFQLHTKNQKLIYICICNWLLGGVYATEIYFVGKHTLPPRQLSVLCHKLNLSS